MVEAEIADVADDIRISEPSELYATEIGTKAAISRRHHKIAAANKPGVTASEAAATIAWRKISGCRLLLGNRLSAIPSIARRQPRQLIGA
ncbi:MAG: hypothetical protein C5B60_03480 [Chloroflexi bacterium]|nr:MAG: hypothetical protein C5B60_03480 [Chloroflexota bacterium]